MPLPLTVTISVSTGVLPWKSVKVIVPVGDEPPERTAESVSVGAVGPSVTFLRARRRGQDRVGRRGGRCGSKRAGRAAQQQQRHRGTGYRYRTAIQATHRDPPHSSRSEAEWPVADPGTDMR